MFSTRSHIQISFFMAFAILLISTLILSGCAHKEFDLYDTHDGVCATVNGVKIGEASITSYINALRLAHGTDDATWEAWLEGYGYTDVNQLRLSLIERFVNYEVIYQAADQDGIRIDKADVQRRIDDVYEQAEFMFPENDSASKNLLIQWGIYYEDLLKIEKETEYLREQLASSGKDIDAFRRSLDIKVEKKLPGDASYTLGNNVDAAQEFEVSENTIIAEDNMAN